MQKSINSIKAILFDLDNTLFDHDRAELESLKKIYRSYRKLFNGISFDTFYERFQINNDMFWKKLVAGETNRWQSRHGRFALTLQDCNLDNSQAAEMFSVYLSIYIHNHYYIDGAENLLRTLKKKKYTLGIITNGFTTVQENKIDGLGIRRYFDTIVMSEKVGVMKPHPKIFDTALTKIECEARDCLFVGDSYESDVVGALRSGLNAVWFNPKHNPPPVENNDNYISIEHLKEIILYIV